MGLKHHQKRSRSDGGKPLPKKWRMDFVYRGKDGREVRCREYTTAQDRVGARLEYEARLRAARDTGSHLLPGDLRSDAEPTSGTLGSL